MQIHPHPLLNRKSLTPPNANSQLHSSSSLRIQREGGLTRTRYRSTHANLARLSSSLPHARLPAPACARTQTRLFRLPLSRASDKGSCSRMSKPLYAIPRAPGPNPQLDPTFPRQRHPEPLRGLLPYPSPSSSPFRVRSCAHRSR